MMVGSALSAVMGVNSAWDVGRPIIKHDLWLRNVLLRQLQLPITGVRLLRGAISLIPDCTVKLQG